MSVYDFSTVLRIVQDQEDDEVRLLVTHSRGCWRPETSAERVARAQITPPAPPMEEPFDGTYPCMGCGVDVDADWLAEHNGCCSDHCYGRMVDE